MEAESYYGDFHRPHEARIHGSLFDSVSRPLSRQSQSQTRSHLFADTKIPWDHYGKKLKIYFSREELDRSGLFESLLRKLREQIREFQGVIAYNNYAGQQVILYKDQDIRTAIKEMGGKLNFYSTVEPGKGFLAASDMRGHRSQSVPPQRQRYSPEDRIPSSMDSNYHYRERNTPPRTEYPIQPRPLNSPSASYSHHQTYGHPLQYVMPPPLAHFLTGGHYPFSKFSWVGPNKYGNFGPYPYKHFYNKGGWGPSW